MAEQGIHHAVLSGIYRRLHPIADSEDDRLEQQETLYISRESSEPVDRPSAEYIVNHIIHIHLYPHPVKKLILDQVILSDEALDVLCDLFATDVTPALTQVELYLCRFSRTDWLPQLIASFQTNTSVTDFKIEAHFDEESTLDSDILAGLIENNPYMLKIALEEITFQLGNEDRLRQALQRNRTLKKFHLKDRHIKDDYFRVITDGLVGNTTLEVLEIRVISGYSGNLTPINALSNITRLLESTRIEELTCGPVHGTIADTATARNFAGGLSRNQHMKSLHMHAAIVSSSVAVKIFQALGRNKTLENLSLQEIQQGDLRLMETLPMMKGLKRLALNHGGRPWKSFLSNNPVPALRQNTSLDDLPGLDLRYYYDEYRDEVLEIKSLFARNRNVKRVVLLLQQPQPDTGRLIPSSSWILRRAIAQLARDAPSGASAIFQMLQIRPTVFDTPMRPPVRPSREPVAAAIPVQQQHNRLIDNADNVHDDSNNVDNKQQQDNRDEQVDDNVNDSNDVNINNSGKKRARLA
jgi:hypothetical protein